MNTCLIFRGGALLAVLLMAASYSTGLTVSDADLMPTPDPRLHYASGPADAPGLILEQVKKLLPSDPGVHYEALHEDTFDKVTPEMLSVEPAPLPIYYVDPDDIVKGLGLQNVEKGNILSYLVKSSGRGIADVDVIIDKIGQAKVSTIHTWGTLSGPGGKVKSSRDSPGLAYERVPYLKQLGNGSYAIRLLVIYPNLPNAIWLKSDEGGADWIYIVDDLGSYAYPGNYQPKEELYTVDEFLNVYRPILKKIIPPNEPADSGPDMTASPAELAAAFPPVVFESKVTVLGPATDLADDLDLHRCRELVTGAGCRIAWVGVEGGKFHAFVDGVPGPGFEGIDFAPEFSPDGQHVTYVATTGKQEQAIVDGVPGPFTHHTSGVSFSPDGQHTISSIEDDNYQHHHFIDGMEVPKYDYVEDLEFSPDSKHLVYEAINSPPNNKDEGKVVLDGTPGPTFEAGVNDFELTFSSDSQHLAYRVESGNHTQVFMDGTPVPLVFAAEMPHGMPIFSPDSKHLAFFGGIEAQSDKKTLCLILDGKSTPLPVGVAVYDPNSNPSLIFSPDSSRIAYLTTSPTGYGPNRKYRLVVDGVPGAEFDHPSVNDENSLRNFSWDQSAVQSDEHIFQFSPDSKHTTLLGMTKTQTGEQWQVVVDGQPGPAFQAYLRSLTFSPDSNRYAYVVEFGEQTYGEQTRIFHQNNWQIVLNKTPGPKFDDMGPRLAFSPDSKHLAFAAAKGDEWRVYVDGTAGPPFAAIAVGPVFCADGRLEYLAIQKDSSADKLVRVDVTNITSAKQ